MTPFNIPKKQLYLNSWIPSHKKRKYYRVLKKNLCYDCVKNYDGCRYSGDEVEWDKIEQGDHSKKRCFYCKKCIHTKNCCLECGYDYQTELFVINESRCGYCCYLNKWGPAGYEYLTLREEYGEKLEDGDYQRFVQKHHDRRNR